MKRILTIWLLMLTGPVFSQHKTGDSYIPKRLLDDITDPFTLSQYLTAPFTTDREKVRAIFDWITGNISYYRGVSRFSRKQQVQNQPIDDEPADTGALKPLTERVAIKVLRDKRTYCDGYARLFQSLCEHAGIRCEIVTGYARSDINRAGARFSSNHAWNAVYVDSGWHLVDVTWASGYVNWSGEFVRHYDDYYFFTPPELFVRHHYPDDLRWTLLDKIPALYEFRYTPFRARSYVKYDITDFYPSRGIIEAKLGDTIHLELQALNDYKSLTIAPDSLWDSSSLVRSPSCMYVQPDPDSQGNKVSYSFKVDSVSTEWLHVMYNNDAVLRYKLKISH